MISKKTRVRRKILFLKLRGKEDSATYHMNVNGCEYDLEVVFSNEKEDGIVPLFSLKTKDDKALELTVFLCHKFFLLSITPK